MLSAQTYCAGDQVSTAHQNISHEVCAGFEDYVKLSAYNIRGNEVDVIFEGAQGVGQHSYTWNAARFPSGVYYIRLQAREDMVTSQKALLIK